MNETTTTTAPTKAPTTDYMSSQRESILKTRDRLGKRVVDHVSLGWYFDKFYEKFILVIVFVLVVWKMWDIVRGIF